MFKMPSFDTNTCPETFVSLIHCIIDDTVPSHARPSSDAAQFINVMNLTSVANVSVHASMPKENIIAFNVTQEYTNN